MIPLPPLDGGRVAVGLLPRALALPLARLERVGIFILVGVLFLLPYLLGQAGIAFDPFLSVLFPIVNGLGGLVTTFAFL
jgi:Zn-dependent protease